MYCTNIISEKVLFSGQRLWIRKKKKKWISLKGKRKQYYAYYAIEQTYQEEDEESKCKRISRENEVMKKSAELKVIKEVEKKIWNKR